jgi:hypothetical protein
MGIQLSLHTGYLPIMINGDNLEADILAVGNLAVDVLA